MDYQIINDDIKKYVSDININNVILLITSLHLMILEKNMKKSKILMII